MFSFIVCFFIFALIFIYIYFMEPSTSLSKCWLFSITVLWWVKCRLLWFAGGAPAELVILHKLIGNASSVTGYKLDTFEAVVEKRSLRNLSCILTVLYTICCTGSGAPSLTDWFSSTATRTDLESLLCFNTTHQSSQQSFSPHGSSSFQPCYSI